jgi:hypothetical protein
MLCKRKWRSRSCTPKRVVACRWHDSRRIFTCRSLPGLRDARALPAFLYRGARNHALAHLRKRDADLRLYAAVDPSHPSADPEPSLELESNPPDASAVSFPSNALASALEIPPLILPRVP